MWNRITRKIKKVEECNHGWKSKGYWANSKNYKNPIELETFQKYKWHSRRLYIIAVWPSLAWGPAIASCPPRTGPAQALTTCPTEADCFLPLLAPCVVFFQIFTLLQVFRKQKEFVVMKYDFFQIFRLFPRNLYYVDKLLCIISVSVALRVENLIINLKLKCNTWFIVDTAGMCLK